MSAQLAAATVAGGGGAGATAAALSISWGSWTGGRSHGRPSARRRLGHRFSQTTRGRPPGMVGVRTLWAMYLVLFVGSALQWLFS